LSRNSACDNTSITATSKTPVYRSSSRCFETAGARDRRRGFFGIAMILARQEARDR
jgi:hypothetical protein